MRTFIAPIVLCFVMSAAHSPVARAAPPELIFGPGATLTGLPDCAPIQGDGASEYVVDLTISNDCGDTLVISTTAGTCAYLCDCDQRLRDCPPLTWTCSDSGDDCAAGLHPLSIGGSGLEVCDGCEVTLSIGDQPQPQVINLEWSLGEDGESGEASLILNHEVVGEEGGCDGGIPSSELDDYDDEVDTEETDAMGGGAEPGSDATSEGPDATSEGPDATPSEADAAPSDSDGASADSSGSEGCHQGTSSGGSPMAVLALLLLWAAPRRRRFARAMPSR